MVQMVYLASPARVDQRCIYLHDFVCIVTIYLGPCSHLTFWRIGRDWAILPLGSDEASPRKDDVCLSSYLQSMHFLQPQKTFGYVISWVQEERGMCQI